MENGMMNGDDDRDDDRSSSPGLTRSSSRGSMNRDSYGRTSLLRRNQSLSAKQISFYRNGDKFFRGLKLAVSVERYKEWDSLLAELSSKVDLPTGAVRFVYCAETGKMITDINELQYGMSYICSSSNSYRDVEGGYGKENQPQWSLHNKKATRDELNNWTDPNKANGAGAGAGNMMEEAVLHAGGPRDYIKPKLVTVIKPGKPPQKKVTMLLNCKTAASLNQVLDHLSAKGTLGKVDRLYTAGTAKQIRTLRDLFDDDICFVALSSNERPPDEGFDLEIQSYKITPYRDLKRPCGLKRSSSLRTPRQYRDSGSNDGGSTPSRPVRRSSSVKSAGGKGSRGRSVSPGPPSNRVNGHTQSNRSKSPSSTGRKTPSGMANLNDELYPAAVFERDMATDSGPVKELKWSKKRRVSVHGLYRIGKIIGDGNFAIVRECKHRKTNKEYALKIINKSKVKGKEHMIENEISILRRVKHNHIVELIEEYETPREIFLVMELIKGGDLFEAIVKATKYTELDASHMVRDLASALDYLHCNNIVHRDIKPENLLVLDLPSGRKSLKLADFGLAMEVKSPMFLVCGTPTYVAPEILDESGYGLKVDIWATGVISYILLCGFPPFRSPDQDELFDFILSGEFEYLSPFWDTISDSAKDLIDHMLVVDVNQRYSGKQILSHAWIKGNTANCRDIHVNLRNEINKNFDCKGRFKGAAIAVHTQSQEQTASKRIMSTQASNSAKSTPTPRDKHTKTPRKYHSVQNLSSTSPRTKSQSPDNNNIPKRTTCSNLKGYTSPYSIKAIQRENKYNSTVALNNSSRNNTLYKNTKSRGSVPNIHTKGLKTANSKISAWVSVPNVSQKLSNKAQVSPRGRSSNVLKKKQAYSCTSLNKHVDPSNQMKNCQSDKCSRESLSKLRHSSPALSSKKTTTKPPMRFGLN